MLVNAKIERAGLYYNGHYRYATIRLELETRGGGASVEIPVERTGEFMEMFEDDLDLENGAFVDQLEGVPVVLETDGDTFGGKITAMGNILAGEDELMELGRSGQLERKGARMDNDVKRDITNKYYAVRDLLGKLFEYATGRAEDIDDDDASAIVKEAEDTLDSMYDDMQATFF